MGDSAWSVKRDWNSSDVKGFADFAQKELKNYDGKNVDCADLALNILIDYANENGLSLQLSNKDGQSFDSNSDNYNSVDDYKNGYKDKNGERQGGVLPNMQASDISANTFTVNKKDAQPGDMIILTKPSNHIANYSQTQPERKLTYGNLRGGKPSAVSTTGDWSNATKDGRGNTMKYDPDNSHAHRWNVLNTTQPQPPTNPQ